MDRNDVTELAREGALYGRVAGTRPRLLIVEPVATRRAVELARSRRGGESWRGRGVTACRQGFAPRQLSREKAATAASPSPSGGANARSARLKQAREA
ncbi:MAG: hypothetical protein LM577_08295 [Thermoproteaceae archaeon]|nr:hypothetical protein [Thermoproteaceae archaeon]